MKREAHPRALAWYLSIALLVTGMLAGTIMATPVGAHVTPGVKHLINKHLKKAFYTKKQANSRYPRVAYGIDNVDTQPSTNPAVLAQTTISAPAAGFLVLQGSADVYESTGDEPDIGCYLRLNATDLESSFRDIELGANNREENCETHTIAPVQAGTHSIQLRAESFHRTTNYDNKVVSAIWIPYGANGSPPSSFTLLRADEAGGTG